MPYNGAGLVVEGQQALRAGGNDHTVVGLLDPADFVEGFLQAGFPDFPWEWAERKLRERTVATSRRHMVLR